MLRERKNRQSEGVDGVDCLKNRRSEMFVIWMDQDAHKFEMKQENSEWWYRKEGEGDDKWEKGRPPGFLQKSINPVP